MLKEAFNYVAWEMGIIAQEVTMKLSVFTVLKDP